MVGRFGFGFGFGFHGCGTVGLGLGLGFVISERTTVMMVMSHTVSGRVGRFGFGFGFEFGFGFGVRYGGFGSGSGFGFGFSLWVWVRGAVRWVWVWFWLWVLGLGLGSGCGTVRWGGVGRGGIGGAADRVPEWASKLNAYRSQCKVKGGCPVRAQRVRYCLSAPLGLSLAPVRV